MFLVSSEDPFLHYLRSTEVRVEQDVTEPFLELTLTG
jgi:hypothetical protein